ncbi:sigma-54-dependent Fis family transcriptional regulator [Rhodococcus sp. B50]|uniref:sigma-54-dependent Fis family transcriptional regulator n=1 Tax=Rhodococcus sp. B50 TaxID=2682847 RepID=UPI001BD4B173|nr:helix-turn-helix domain-containing protein [Rhodococcus sp. B50]MBS9374749.1 Acetoin dehydrogenase operon transcriptional activator AcoR [Rhodococcus sp. B50]
MRNWLRVSWLRSAQANVDTDQPGADYIDPDSVDTVLTRAAAPVLDAMAQEIESEPVSLILTDASGTVLRRRLGDIGLAAALDSVHLAPGFRYAETNVGTNGIGTSLEVGAPLLIRGDEHYNGRLRRFSCAGAPVTHPVTGAVLGAVDLTTLAENTNALLLSFAKMVAQRIREQILEEAGELDRALLRDYHLACQHSGRPVIAIGDEVLMINDLTHRVFDSRDQAAIIDRTRDSRGRSEPFTLLADLPSGVTARLSYRPTFVDHRLAGGIVHIKEQVDGRRTRSGDRDRAPVLRSVAGTSATWTRTVEEMIDACARGEWIVVDGEPGTGKSTSVRAVHEYSRNGHELVCVDASTSSTDEIVERVATAVEDGSDLLIHRVHSLDEDTLDAVSDLLLDVSSNSAADDSWVAVTMHSAQGLPDTHPLLRLFPKTVQVPPLRHHIEDLPELSRYLLDGMGAANLTLSRAAANQLARVSWSGNVAHLKSVLEDICRRRRSGTIELDDLPAECRSTTRRRLTRLESLERDAVVEALALHNGDKVAAAKALGMSRATIYRKIREYGIEYRARSVRSRDHS